MNQSFSKDVSQERLESFVEAILSRLQQHRVTYDHLQTSVSKMHNEYLSSTESTFKVLNQVIEDQVAMPIRARILADSYVTKRLHSTQEEAEKQLLPILEEMLSE